MAKIRLGFVSNSSSSSFIVAFNREPESAEDVASQMFGDISTLEHPYYDDIYNALDVAKTVFADMKMQTPNSHNDIVESINLFDVYTGKPIPKNKKSLAFSIRFRSAERTLTDAEVDDLHARIIKRLKENLNAELRS